MKEITRNMKSWTEEENAKMEEFGWHKVEEFDCWDKFT